MSFARPWLLLLLLAIPWWLWYRRRRRSTGAGYSDVTLVEGTTTGGWILALPPILRVITLAAWIIAAAGPRSGGTTIEQKKEGIAIVVAIDISSSMLAEDFAPSNRFEVAKTRAAAFIRARDADRIGLVIFAGEALTLVPLTVDYAVLERAVLDLRMGVVEDGTAIGTGLATALNRLRRVPDRSKVVLLLTDGVNNRGTIDPRTAAQAATALGVKVYTIGIGTEGEAPIPTGRGVTGFRYEILPVKIDETLMQEMAEMTGGRYFRAKDSEALNRIFQQIDALEKSPIHVTSFTRYEELVRPFVLAGLVALGLELLLVATVAVRVP